MRLSLLLWVVLLVFLHFSVPVRLSALPLTSAHSATHIHLTISTPTYNPTIFPNKTLVPPPQILSTHIPSGTISHIPRPTRTRGEQHRRKRRQTPIVIFFETLCGILALVFFLGLMKCCYSYKKTPRHDRVSGFISRHRLQMELEEQSRRPPMTRRFPTPEPAPPYVPRPPSYVELPRPETHATHAEYDIISTSSPDSPTSSQASLEEVHPPASNHCASSE